MNLRLSQQVVDAIVNHNNPNDILQMAEIHHLNPDDEETPEIFGIPNSFSLTHRVLLAGIRERHVELVQYILDGGYSVHSPNAKRMPLSAMHLACCLGYEDVIQLFVSVQANVHSLAMDPEGQYKPAMAIAMRHDRPSLIRKLVPLYMSEKDMYSRTTLHFACEEGAFECTKYLVEEYPESIHMKDFTMLTPLMVAVRQDVRFVKLLLDKGAKIQTHTPDKHRQVLHLLFCNAIGSQRNFLPRDAVEIAKLLISKGADVNRMDKHMETPLSLVCGQIMTELHQMTYNKFPYSLAHHHEVIRQSVELLIESGANLNLETRDSPLNVVMNGVRATLEALTGRYRSNIHSGIGTPQLLGTLIFSLDLMELLLKKGTNPDSINVYFLTPLTQMFVHLHGCRYVDKEAWKEIWPHVRKVFTLLLLHGAQDVDIKEAFWHPPYDNDIIKLVLHALPQSVYNEQVKMAESRVASKTSGVDENVMEHRKWLKALAQNPRKLRNLARSELYSILRYKLEESVPKLPLPSLLQEYMLSFK